MSEILKHDRYTLKILVIIVIIRVMMNIAVIGGGAAGFFAALTAKQTNPKAEVILIEGTNQLLSKVRISGGGRCNVTHFCFYPKELIQHYPRGNPELLGPFFRFQPRDTIQWFESRGVKLKNEADGRVFPFTDSSETIIRCLIEESKKLGVKIRTQCKLKSIEKLTTGFMLDFGNHRVLTADRVILATGSSRSGWIFAKRLGHHIEHPVPSLFTFKVPNFTLEKLSGISVSEARVRILDSRFVQEGPLLITHWGFSGPAVLKLSAFAARFLSEKNYSVDIAVDWLSKYSEEELYTAIENEKRIHPKRFVVNLLLPSLPKKLARALIQEAGIKETMVLADMRKAKIANIIEKVKRNQFSVHGSCQQGGICDVRRSCSIRN